MTTGPPPLQPAASASFASSISLYSKSVRALSPSAVAAAPPALPKATTKNSPAVSPRALENFGREAEAVKEPFGCALSLLAPTVGKPGVARMRHRHFVTETPVSRCSKHLSSLSAHQKRDGAVKQKVLQLKNLYPCPSLSVSVSVQVATRGRGHEGCFGVGGCRCGRDCCEGRA